MSRNFKIEVGFYRKEARLGALYGADVEMLHEDEDSGGWTRRKNCTWAMSCKESSIICKKKNGKKENIERRY